MNAENVKKATDLQRFKVKRILETLKSKKGFHTELISLYIPHDRKLSDVTNYLKNEVSESQNIKSKLTRKNVLDGISTLLGMLKNYREVSDNGLVMFAGAIPQNNTPGTERMEKYILDAPEKVNTFRYHCASEFLTRPLEEMLETKETYGLLVIGRKKSAVGYLRGNHMEEVREFTSNIHGKHKAGGQSQKRFERLIEEGEISFYRHISSEVNELFLGMEQLQGIFIGGPGPSKEKFVNDESLDYRLREKILDTVDLGYGGTEGLRALVEKVKNQIENVKYVREQFIWQNFMKQITSDIGMAIYGQEEVERALNLGAVDTLIMSEQLGLYKIKRECSNCQHYDYITSTQIKIDESNEKVDLCPNCNSNSFSTTDYYPIIEYLGDIAESLGSNVEILSGETEGGETLKSTFGGVVAILRYKIDY
ncbi:MAG: peptide chain release factor aRF-1 [Candidatus Lokiarchaeota archaeon]|nr:peptide chain release factor aRF-1 [Candidatus Lokiarchaeota archaeon]